MKINYGVIFIANVNLSLRILDFTNFSQNVRCLLSVVSLWVKLLILETFNEEHYHEEHSHRLSLLSYMFI